MTRIVASLTTIPGRIFRIRKTVMSLINQTRKLDQLYINIPHKFKNQTYDIPQFLVSLEKKRELKIIRCEDYGPITKLVPTMFQETDPDTYLIIFDDDVIVDEKIVQILEGKIELHPRSALSFSGRIFGYFPFYFEYVCSNKQDRKVDWVQGCHSICLKREWVDQDLLSSFSDAPKIDRNDDHRISGYLAQKGISRIVINYNADDYIKFTDYSRISPISAGPPFVYFVIRLCWYFRNKGLYTEPINTLSSVSLHVFTCVAVIVAIVFLIQYIK